LIIDFNRKNKIQTSYIKKYQYVKYIVFLLMLDVVLLAFIFHEIVEKSKNISPTEYIKLESLLKDVCIRHWLWMAILYEYK